MGCAASKPCALDEDGRLPAVRTDAANAKAGALAKVNSMHSVDGGIMQDSMSERAYVAQTYQPAQPPMNESDRLDALYATGVLDTPSDPRFDDITKLLSNILKMPMAIVVLVDQYRCWLKSNVGVPYDEVHRDASICAWTLLPTHPEMLVVQDCREDARFKNCPLVTNPPHLRFYAGAPLVTSHGYRLGNLCVMDSKPRQLDAEGCNLLGNFAEIVVRQIEKTTMGWSRSYLVNQRAQGLLRALDWFSEGLMLCHTGMGSSDGAGAAGSGVAAGGGGNGWNMLYVNDAWTKLTGRQAQSAVGTDWWQMADLVNAEAAMAQIRGAMQVGAPFSAEFVLRDSRRRLAGTFRPAHLGQLHDAMPTVGIPSHVPWQLTGAASPGGEGYYFGTLRPVDMSLSASSSASGSLLGAMAAGMAGGGGGGCDGVGAGTAERDLRRTVTSNSSRWQWEGQEPFRDVVMGPVLGRGSFGKVFRGVWQGTPVAIKVMQFQRSNVAEGKALARLEAQMNLKVSHPHIVPTYKTACRTCKAGALPMDPPACSVALTRTPPPGCGPCSRPLGAGAWPSSSSSTSSLSTAGHNGTSGNGADTGGGVARSSLDSSEPSWPLSDSSTECSGAFTPQSATNGCSNSASGGGNGARSAGSNDRVTFEVWMAMELCDMGTLVEACDKGWLRSRPREGAAEPAGGAICPDLRAVCETAREVASAMTYLHGRDVIHGDLTGSNVLLVSNVRDERRFCAKVSDFGLSRVLRDGPITTETAGTMSHMPPEMLSDGVLCTETDVYAFGVLLWEMYMGQRAWAGMHPMQIMFNVAVKKRQLEFPEPQAHEDGGEDECCSVAAARSYIALAKECLSPERTERPAFDAVLERLDDILHDDLGKKCL